MLFLFFSTAVPDRFQICVISHLKVRFDLCRPTLMRSWCHIRSVLLVRLVTLNQTRSAKHYRPHRHKSCYQYAAQHAHFQLFPLLCAFMVLMCLTFHRCAQQTVTTNTVLFIYYSAGQFFVLSKHL